MKAFLLALIGIIALYPLVGSLSERGGADSFADANVENWRPIQLVGVAHARSHKERMKREETDSAPENADSEASAAEMRYRDAKAAGIFDREDTRLVFLYLFSALSLYCVVFAVASTNKDIGFYLLGHGGLRYIALLLIVTALVLFGVEKILEGKEISALLGTIAGYILGAGGSAGFGVSKVEDIREISNSGPLGRSS